ncbi:hypothetical protein AnigIFM49718_011771 [Aspergillus niger]|nr:hypothetical protein AnigIFM49718_011771 [Aspergillus niger]
MRGEQWTGRKLPKRIRRYAGIHRAWHQIRVIQLSVRQLRLAGFQQAVRVAQASAGFLKKRLDKWIHWAGASPHPYIWWQLNNIGKRHLQGGCGGAIRGVGLGNFFSLEQVPTRWRGKENSAKHSPGFGPSPSIWWSRTSRSGEE